MAALPWKDPLGGIVIERHPTPETSVLSSALSNPDVFHDRMEEVGRVFGLYQPNAVPDDTTRVLRHAVDNLPKLGSLQLIGEILEIDRDHEKLRQLRNFFVDAVLKPIGSTTGKTAVPSRRSADSDETVTILSGMEVSTRDEQRALKQNCLRRDGYRCMISGKFDLPSRQDELYHPNPGEIGKYTMLPHSPICS
ncbi:hypothetical protein GGS23DRAFT_359584 [Durotheca rogersii]|uniref:uncharacterized protein n=1 Tax=Durotheca rogersii TaxID=419775 RepID=UPI00221E580F|nr:uncharacterized protein GGS23DRAFT_359584 [Durotheca rogersii]KAI5865908.1 hypothetical protein GGS23DRAFT_359584 [Durotheca rogersii]